MPLYKYTATDSQGTKKTGVVDARAKETAVVLLKNQGLFVISLTEKKQGFFSQITIFSDVPRGEVVAFTRQFSTMMSSGLPVSRALEVLSKQATNKRLKLVLFDVLR